jgi:tetratricopeptide (TPR) repeat protein
MYEQGLRAHFRGERTVARTFFEAAVAEDSLFALAHYYSALVADDVTEGRRRLERARQLATRASDRERLTIMAGWASAMSAPSLRAIADTLAIRYPTEMAGYLSLGIALVSDGEYLGALGPLGHVLAMDSTGLHSAAAGWAACAALRWTVTAYQLADSLAAAERVARRWVRLHPGSRAAVQALVEVLDVQGRGPAADSALRATGSRVIDDAEALYRRASSLMRGGDFDAADRLIGEVLEAGGVHEQVDAYWLLAISLRQQGRLSEALDATRHMRAIAPRTSQQIPGSAPSLAALEAQILLELGRPRAAAALFDSIARGREQLDSKHTAARRAAWTLTHVASARAAALDTVALDRLADGIQSLGTLSGYGRDRRLHHHVRGLLLAARGDGEGAVAEFRQSIFSWNYGYTRTNLELARTLMRLGRAAEAVAVLQPALRGSVEASNLYVTRTELHELLAESWDAANGRDSAVAHYRVVARAWNRADPHLQPRRARAEARAAELAYRPCGPGACAGHNGK